MLKLENVEFVLGLCGYMIRKRKVSRSSIIAFCKARLKKRPNDVFCRQVLAWMYSHAVRDYARAATEYKKLIAQGEESFDLYKALGFAQRNAGDFPGAIAAFEMAERVRPGDLTILAELGYAYMREERYAEALDALQKAIDFGHPEGFVNRYRGFCFLKMGDFGRAAEEYEKAISKGAVDKRLAEEAAMAHTNLGIKLLDEGILDLSAHEFHKAMELDSTNVEAVVGLSKVMLSKREFAKALELGYEMISKHPGNYRGYLIVGSALKEQGRTSDAIAICERGRMQSKDPGGELSQFLTGLYRSLG